MKPHEYQEPDGSIVNKRTWPIGTAVTVKRRDGTRFDSSTLSVPRLFGSGAWGVRVKGAAAHVHLDQVDRRYQLDLLPTDPEGTSGSEKDSSTP